MTPTMKPLDILIRHCTIDGAATVDARVVITADGRAAMFGRPNGEIAPLSAMTEIIEWGITAAGRLNVTDGTTRWEGDRESRCGSCGGRYELRSVDPELFLPSVTEVAEPAE